VTIEDIKKNKNEKIEIGKKSGRLKYEVALSGFYDGMPFYNK